jgi:hypothetical protein
MDILLLSHDLTSALIINTSFVNRVGWPGLFLGHLLAAYFVHVRLVALALGSQIGCAFPLLFDELAGLCLCTSHELGCRALHDGVHLITHDIDITIVDDCWHHTQVDYVRFALLLWNRTNLGSDFTLTVVAFARLTWSQSKVVIAGLISHTVFFRQNKFALSDINGTDGLRAWNWQFRTLTNVSTFFDIKSRHGQLMHDDLPWPLHLHFLVSYQRRTWITQTFFTLLRRWLLFRWVTFYGDRGVGVSCQFHFVDGWNRTIMSVLISDCYPSLSRNVVVYHRFSLDLPSL